MTAQHVLSIFLLLVGLAASSLSPQRVRQDATTTADGPGPIDTSCGSIIDKVNQGKIYMRASKAFDCLKSVPFNDAVALRFIEYYNTTLQFQSTLAYLKKPPQGYQQPAVDLIAGLQDIKNNVTAGAYMNQYTFEAELLRLVYSAHDTHVELYAGITSTFSFASEWDIVSASTDGTLLPEIFIANDIVQYQSGYAVSPITLINGVNASDFLERFAALNSVGMVEPHADWNQLMYSPVQTVLGYDTTFSGGATFYEGDWLNYTFANGSTLDTRWIAIYTYADFTGPLTTGGDFYNYFVLGLTPASYDSVPLPDVWKQIFDANTSVPETIYTYEHGWDNITGGAYPRADVMQADLNTTGYVTGYFLEDISTAVLSIPTFQEYGRAVRNFSTAVDGFLQGAHNRSLNKLIIDLQGNWGGTPLLAFTTFRSIFPRIDPFAGSRRRSHELADVLGSTISTHYNMSGNEWFILDRLNAKTGRNFTSWSEYFGPQNENGDTFSLVEKYDLANRYFDWDAFDGWAPTRYLAGYEDKHSAVFEAEDVVLLTDGSCSSTCVLFVEMMTQQAGVRTMVVGGQPRPGPMQAASGSRGAAAYSSYSLDLDINHTIHYDARTKSQFPTRDPGMKISYAGFNLRDQIRTADDQAGPPLQFTYLAADCRLWFTLDNIFNLTKLWSDVATAAWTDSSRCVSGSMGYAASLADSTATIKVPPASSATSLPDLPPETYEDTFEVPPGTMDTEAIRDVRKSAEDYDPPWPCDSRDRRPCSGTARSCVKVEIGCRSGEIKRLEACVNTCYGIRKSCDGSQSNFCEPYSDSLKRGTTSLKIQQESLVRVGVCIPFYGTEELGCPASHWYKDILE